MNIIVDHNADSFYIRVNDAGRNFRLVTAPVTDPGSKNWHEVMAHNPAIMLDDIDLFKNFGVLYERENGLPQIRVVDLRNGHSRRLAFPEPAYAVYPYTNRVYDTTEFRYGYQSPITPQSVFSYDMETGASQLLKQKEVPGGYDPQQISKSSRSIPQRPMAQRFRSPCCISKAPSSTAPARSISTDTVPTASRSTCFSTRTSSAWSIVESLMR